MIEMSSVESSRLLHDPPPLALCSFSGSTPVAPGGFAFGAKYVSAVQAARPGAGSGATGSDGGGGEQALRAAPIIAADLDSELAQQLQKLSKRDATTKLKALQVGAPRRACRTRSSLACVCVA
jgi:hypothetical protein